MERSGKTRFARTRRAERKAAACVRHALHTTFKVYWSENIASETDFKWILAWRELVSGGPDYVKARWPHEPRMTAILRSGKFLRLVSGIARSNVGGSGGQQNGAQQVRLDPVTPASPFSKSKSVKLFKTRGSLKLRKRRSWSTDTGRCVPKRTKVGNAVHNWLEFA